MTFLAPLDARDPVSAAVDVHGNRPALITADGTLTYRDLDERVTSLADELGPTRRLVLLHAANTVEAVVGYLAARRAGHVALLADAENAHASGALVATYDPDVVIAGAEVDIRRCGTSHGLHPELSLLLSTSGSTGSSKLVRLSRGNLVSNATAIADYLGLTPADRAVTSLPLHYCYGLSVLNSHLAVGASLVLSELSVVDRCFWRQFRDNAATSFAGVPHTFELLERTGFDQLELPSLRYITQAGGRMDPNLVRRYAELGERDGWELFVMYGQTEATARMAYLPPHLASSRPSAVGVAIPGGSLSIASPDANGVGEVVYHGPNVMLGYASSPRDLSTGRAVAELRTGDLGRIAEDGLLEIVGRRSRIIKPFGVRVDLDDLEGALADTGLAARCAGDDTALVVAVESPEHIDPAIRFLDDRLGLPPSRRHVIELADPPRLPNGKLDYRAIRHLAGTTAAPAPRADLRAAFADVLDVDVAQDDDTFVSLGGDSLSYVEMSLVLEEILGDVPADWHRRTIADLEERHRNARCRRWARLDTTIVLRAVAIVLIVGTHTELWHLPGGAHALLAVAGFNFARFQLDGQRRWARMARIAAPSACWIAVAAATSDRFSWPHVVMLNGILGNPDARWAYWFMEALITILVALALMFSIAPVRRAAQRAPFAFASAMVAVALVVRFDLVVDLTTDHRLSRPHEVFWLFAIGWAASVAATNRQRSLVTALALFATVGFFHDTLRELIVIGAIGAMTWTSTVPVPRRLPSSIGALAGASMYIYLTHFQLYPPLRVAAGPLGATVASLAVGAAAERVTTSARRRVARSVRGARPFAKREGGAGETTAVWA